MDCVDKNIVCLVTMQENNKITEFKLGIILSKVTIRLLIEYIILP